MFCRINKTKLGLLGEYKKALEKGDFVNRSHNALEETKRYVYTTNNTFLLREFVCPGCGALLDSEIALPGDPFLEDIVAP